MATTEGLAIVAPGADAKPSQQRLAVLGLVAGAQVIVQLAPLLLDGTGRTFEPATVAGLPAGMAIMFATGLLVSV